MRSIKPGRGPSMMGGVGALGVAVFGVFWTIMASSIGAPPLFTVFGIIFIVMALISGAYNFMNATSKNRYSSFDITDENEEPDPMNQYFGEQEEYTAPVSHSEDLTGSYPGNPADNNPKSPADNNSRSPEESNFCPYCGAQLQPGFEFCNKCGRKLP